MGESFLDGWDMGESCASWVRSVVKKGVGEWVGGYVGGPGREISSRPRSQSDAGVSGGEPRGGEEGVKNASQIGWCWLVELGRWSRRYRSCYQTYQSLLRARSAICASVQRTAWAVLMWGTPVARYETPESYTWNRPVEEANNLCTGPWVHF